jgi:hypothetical protein
MAARSNRIEEGKRLIALLLAELEPLRNRQLRRELRFLARLPR